MKCISNTSEIIKILFSFNSFSTIARIEVTALPSNNTLGGQITLICKAYAKLNQKFVGFKKKIFQITKLIF